MKKLLGIIVMLVMFVPLVSLAADFRASENPNVGKDENVRNLYTAGQNVNIDANVAGDLTVAGNVVNVNGNVERNIQAAGSTINLKGNAGGNVRVAGGSINVDGTIGEDLVVFSGQVNINSSAVISRDLIVYGGTVIVNGKVNGKVVGSVGEITFNNSIGGNVDLRNVGKITMGSSAAISGKLTYGSKQKLSFDESKVSGGVQFNQITVSESNKNAFAGAVLGFSIIGLIGSFLLLFVLTLLAPRTAERFVEASFASPWANMGIGFVTMVVVPIVLIALMFTIIGLPIAGFGFLVYLLLLILAGIFSALLIGSLLVKFLGRKEGYEIGWLPVLVGVLVAGLLKFVPVVGWLIVFLFFLVALGAFVRMLWTNITLQTKPVK